ncbi:MAG: helix-turn-helix domain-containing protein [Eubacterium sp.]|nr:helix-turn-helix domain-containing protein [Eubacterium sp.]
MKKENAKSKETKSRKEEIIYATLTLAAEKGLGAVSMQQIADRVGITKASLYNHFSSRDEIVDAMYEILREASKKNTGAGDMDYDKLISGRTLAAILKDVIGAYRGMISDPEMKLFYAVIMSERSINPAAAEIMIRETQTMIGATKMLFYALQAKGVVKFDDPDAAAFAFAMGVHSILNYEMDLIHAGEKSDSDMMDSYIDEFARAYGNK